MNGDRNEITELLDALSSGEAGALDQLFDAVYQELRRVAHGQRGGWRGGETLNTTALVHEAYLKLAGSGNQHWQNRGHFFAVASKAMRRILIDRARYANAERRGGGDQQTSLTGVPAPTLPSGVREDLLSLDSALMRLEALDPRQAKVVECRFFGGLDVEETALAVGISTATVKRSWRVARAWLYRELQTTPPAPD